MPFAAFWGYPIDVSKWFRSTPFSAVVDDPPIVRGLASLQKWWSSWKAGNDWGNIKFTSWKQCNAKSDGIFLQW